VHFTVDEGTVLFEQAKRSGTTIVQTLCSAWSGRSLGQANATAETRRIIEARRVRVAAVINMQTRNGHLMLTDTVKAIGLPQRVCFASAHDPTMPAVNELPDWPGPLDYQTPPMVPTGFVLEVDDAIVAEIQEHRHAIATGRRNEPELDGHLGLMRLKIAGLLAMLDGRRRITVEDWRLAGEVTAASTRIRARLVAVKQADDTVRRIRAADGRAEFESHVDDVKERKAVAKLTESIIRRTTEAGAKGIGRAELRRACTAATTRHRFEDALHQAIDRGAVEERDERIYTA
jgi:hypothetical protein